MKPYLNGAEAHTYALPGAGVWGGEIIPYTYSQFSQKSQNFRHNKKSKETRFTRKLASGGLPALSPPVADTPAPPKRIIQ